MHETLKTYIWHEPFEYIYREIGVYSNVNSIYYLSSTETQ